MKKVILGTVLFTLSGSVLSSSLQDQLAAVAQAEQQGKMKKTDSVMPASQTRSRGSTGKTKASQCGSGC